jgi:two-component sensor histidine kinase
VYATASNTSIDGPDIALNADAGQKLAMVFHELATNAVKFGAISTGADRLSVSWSLVPNEHVDHLSGWVSAVFRGARFSAGGSM